MVYSYSYKIGFVKTLLHRAFVISSNWSIFDLEVGKTKELLENNLYPGNSINQQTKNTCMCNLVVKKINNLVILHLFHFTNSLSTEIKQKIIKHCKHYCKNTNVIIVILPFKVEHLFSFEESVSKIFYYLQVYMSWL